MSKSQQHRQSQRAGVIGEQLAERVMFGLGIRLVEQIATPTKFVRGKMIHVGKVSGDRRGVLPPNGLSVHAEVKTYKTENLAYSALKSHQRDWLTRHAQAGGLSLLIWVSTFDIYVMEWGIDGIPGYMKPRSSITPELARSLNIDSLRNKAYGR